MENWEQEFQQKLKNIYQSKNLNSYENIRESFDSVYCELTQGKDSSKMDVIWNRKSDTKSWYYVYHYALIIQLEDESIAVFKYDESVHPETKEKIAEIFFENGYSYLEYTRNDKKDFLSIESIYVLFKNAYSKLLG